ncbi:hypothetical protein FE257_000271 [Aspergillus nanangensis]|uniref:A to I editase domain-containing protein n=1 Tax=Aspergillus nanangensis TaxID=2582783 RepID=A0AAD4CZ26_ASPNN|nr:hypothetical protein FE257_000271 [Aspergillus nanangensis]
MEESLPCRIASLVHAHFEALPARSKPIIRPDGTREWIPMSGIVVVKGENTPEEKLACVAVTSGAKCLPASQIPTCKGLVLHDCHAEILALRAFNYWLLSECKSFLAGHQQKTEDGGDSPSVYLRRRRQQQQPHNPRPQLELCPDLKIYMYCTCAPCGDASMELCMASQDDATPWEPNTHNTTPSPAPPDTEMLDGRGYFSRLGIVRRKPARADAESTRSKSCSDKLALRQVSSLLSYESSLIVAVTENAYLAGIVLPEEEISRAACERAFSERGRMSGLVGEVWDADVVAAAGTSRCGDGYRFRPFRVFSIPTEQLESLWRYRKPRASDPVDERMKVKPGVVSGVWVAAAAAASSPSATSAFTGTLANNNNNNGVKSLPTLCGTKTGLYETILNGVKQGNRASEPMARGASALSRARLWGFLRDIAMSSHSPSCVSGEREEVVECDWDILRRIVTAPTYWEFKKAPVDPAAETPTRKRAIRETKTALQGWVSNVGDESWGLDVLVDPPKKKR